MSHMNYMDILKQWDDPVHLDAPIDFDFKVAEAKFARFVSSLPGVPGITYRAETGILIQDASFHSQIIIRLPNNGQASIRFSNFGELVTVIGIEQLPEEERQTIETIAQFLGYVYVPSEVLTKPYTGSNPGIDGIPDWLTRYFGWV